MTAWSVRQATAGDRDAAVALLARAHAGDAAAPPTKKEWDWLYLENTAGAGLQYLVADAGDRLAGQYATLPVRMQLAGSEQNALISLNTATDPDFQHQGIFTALAGRLYAKAAPRFAFVYGFPNERSAHGLFDRLQWVDLGRVPIVARLLRTPAQLRRARFPISPFLVALRARDAAVGRLGGVVEPIESFGDWADDLWWAVAPSLGICAVRDARFLEWRFAASPHEYYRWAFRSNGRVTGLAVSKIVEWHGARIAWLMELLVRPDERFCADALLSAVIADAHQSGAVAVCAPALPRAPYRGALARAAFVPLPRRFARDFSFGVRPFGDQHPEALSRDAWYLSGADFDWL